MIRVRLKEVLARHHLSTYQLAKVTTGVSPKTVYAVSAGRAVPSLAALDQLVTALRRLTGEPVEPGDLLAYEPPPEPLTAEDTAWLGADLSRLGEVEPYEWGPAGPPAGLPLRREPGVGLVVQGAKRYGP